MNGLVEGLARKYRVNRLVFYESLGSINDAIAAEKRMKKWKRNWKVELIEKRNPKWSDLYV